MPKFSRFSLRSRALVLVMLAILPLLALTLYAYFDQRDRAIREVQRDELVAARNMAITLENLFSNTGQLLTALARLPEVQRRDRAACAALLAGVLGQCPYYAVLLVVDPQGQLLASAPAAPGPVNYADRRWFKEVVQAKALVISEPIIGRFTKKYVYNLAFPILDEAGRFQGAITAGIDLQWLGGLLAKSNLPPTTAIVLSDASHKVFFRYPEPLKYSGRMLHDHLIKEMTGRNEGVSAGVGLPGDERLFSFARLSPPWQEKWVLFGLPRDWAVGPVNRALGRNLIFLGLVALLAVAAAWYGGELFIVRPVKRLRRVTERLAAGDLSVRSGPDQPPGELGLLAHAFDQMADSLEERKEETQRLLSVIQEEKDRLTALVNSINDEVWFADTQKKFTLANPSALREFGLDPSQDTDIEEFAASLEVYRADGSLRPTEEAPALRALQGELIRNLEEIIRTPATGELRHRQVSAAPVRDVNGNIIGSVCVVRDITDLKRAEEALRESEAKYRNLFENMTEEVHFWQLERDEAGRIKTWRLVDANPPTLKTWDRSNIDEIKGKTTDEIFGPGSTDHYFPVVQKIMTEGVPYVFEDYFPNLDKYFRFTSVPLGDFFITTGADITNIKKAEEALRESEKRLRLLGDNLPDSAVYQFVHEADGKVRFLHMSEGIERLNGVTAQNVLNDAHTLHRLTLPEDYERLVEAEAKSARELSDFDMEVQIRRPDGEIRWMRLHSRPRRLPDGSTIWDGVQTDITERKHAEEALRESRAKLQAAFASMTEAIFIADAEGRLIDFNDEFVRYHRFRDRDECSQTIADCSKYLDVWFADGTPAPLEQWAMPRALRGETASNVEYRLCRKETGVMWWGSYNFGPLKDQDGKIIGAVVAGRDITELKQAEEALRRLNEELELRVQRRTADLEKANDLLKKSEEHLRYLASKILTTQEQERKRLAMELHDGLGQSLSALKMYLRAIQRHLPKEAEVVKEDFEDAQKLLRDTIEETRKISRGLSPTLLENLGLTAAVRYLLDEFGKHHKTEITFDIDDIRDLFPHQTEINLFRVCQEAINNIAKHSLATQISVAIKRRNGSVDFSIKDNGVGFDLDQFDQEDLAEKGMGLAAMDERLRMIGAQLDIVSQTGRGTEISFSIPCDAQ